MMSSSKITQYQRLRNLRHAKGILELVSCQDDRWGLDERLKQKMARRAVSLLNEGQPKGRKLAVWHYSHARSLILLGKFAAATRDLHIATKLDPNITGAFLALGWCYKRTGQIDQAIVSLTRAVDQTPDHPLIRYNLACYLSLAGQPEQAALELSVALELQPSLRSNIGSESDFDPIRHHPAFDAVTQVIV